MKRRFFYLMAFTFITGIALTAFFIFQDSDFRQDVIAANEVLHSVQNDWDKMAEHINPTNLDYTVLDQNGAVLFRTRSGLRESIGQAVVYRDSILDVESDGDVVGKIILFNNESHAFQEHRYKLLLVLSLILLIQWGICIAYFSYLDYTLVRPFHKLKAFAQRVAGGNLDIPLTMDRHMAFGAFTESFDLMRSQLKQAKIAEAHANADKKELIAKLSHDIRTPVASIKATAEVGAALTEYAFSLTEQSGPAPTLRKETYAGHPLTDQLPLESLSSNPRRPVCSPEDTSSTSMQLLPDIKNHYIQIIRKADQINALVTGLFTATLEELQQLPVTPADLESEELQILLENSDYLHRGTIPAIPQCLLHADKLRLQQVFDNIFGNSYKYADTKIDIAICMTDRLLAVTIEDYGRGVSKEDLPFLKDKFRRGSNAEKLDGAGLGLYISDYFMKEMQGALTVENGRNGLRITVEIPLR